MSLLTVDQLIAEGARHADTEVDVVGWAIDQFEHRAVYNSAVQVKDTVPSKGIWLAGALPARKPSRGDGPLHTLRVKITGRFHWQPKHGAGHFGLFPAWIGVKSYIVLQDEA